MGAKEASETTREREVFKYYQPTIVSTTEFLTLPSQSSHDATLTAFAQFGALRLNATRGTISLVAREHQYIIAQATRAQSLRNDAIDDEADNAWRDETTMRRSDRPCSVAMDIFTGVIEGKREHLFVGDLSADDRFCHMKSVAESPFMKFYAAVPLVTAKGLVVGAFYVADDKPRNGVSDSEMAFMEDISSTIMAHLEAKRVKQQHQRAEKMIRGLGLYVEGKSSLRDWWLKTGHKTNEFEVTEKSRRGETLMQQVDQEFGIQDSPDALATAAIASIPSMSERISGPTSKSGMKIPLTSGVTSSRPQYGQESYSDTTSSAAPSETPDTTFTSQPGTIRSILTRQTSMSSNEPARDMPHNTQNSPHDLRDEISGARLQEAVLSNELMQSISRASNLIRESIAVDGALFLDASVGTFGGSSKKADLGFNGPSARNDQSMPFTTSSSDEARQSGGYDATSSQKMCGILGYSTSTRSSLNMHEPSALHLSVTESFLRKLLRRYPHGKVFNFDDEGSLSSSDDDVRRNLQKNPKNISEELQDISESSPYSKRKKKRMSKEAEGKEILTLLPGARCVAFFPLWDSHKERWFAGSMVWTTNPTRILDPEEDLTYLASFGNSIMAEVSRLDALVSSQVKDSFVSSISHELRSPLHGVLASVEFLQDSPLNVLQQEMVSIIGSCGRTLLDTINHVLDFTKFKGTTKKKAQDDKKLRPRGLGQSSSASFQSSLMQGINPVDIRILTEEVLEGVYTGSGFQTTRPIISTSNLTSPSDSSLPLPSSLTPMIIVNMEWRSNWEFEIDPGAWRRLVMNIFGNALKYTESGFVWISLGSRDEINSSTGALLSVITLTVSDSGKGISKEFLNHHLYTPFAQEDSLAVGSGLGLSIVRSIVNELKGSVNIESEKESGTDVIISLPLTAAKRPTLLEGVQDDILQIRNQTQGLKACLVGFDVFPNIVDEPTGILSIEAKRMFHFKDSLTALLKDWFGMKVAVESGLDHSTAAVSFIMESTLSNLLSTGFQASETEAAENPKPILLVLCARPYKSYEAVIHPYFDIIHVQQPIGPQKLGNTLARCLALSLETQEHTSRPRSGSTLPTVTKPITPILDPSLPVVSLPQRPPLFHRVSSKGSKIRSKTVLVSPSSPSTTSMSGWPQSADRPGISIQTNLTAHTDTTGRPSSRSVLLVEDNPINLKILVTYMQKLGIEYATAENGLVAVQEHQCAARPFNLVLMDISMPVMDGLEASRKIRVFEKESKRGRVPIVAITGAASESTRQEAFSAGIDQFLTKPVSLKLLRELVEQYGFID